MMFQKPLTSSVMCIFLQFDAFPCKIVRYDAFYSFYIKLKLQATSFKCCYVNLEITRLLHIYFIISIAEIQVIYLLVFLHVLSFYYLDLHERSVMQISLLILQKKLKQRLNALL